jgi:hypothetical protein
MTYQVLCSALSLNKQPRFRGEIVTSDELDADQIARLVESGAIMPVLSGDAQAKADSEQKPAETTEPEVKVVPLARMNRAQLLGVMAEFGLSPANEDDLTRAEMIKAIMDAQAKADAEQKPDLENGQQD